MAEAVPQTNRDRESEPNVYTQLTRRKPEEIEMVLAQMDAANVQHRAAVMDAIEADIRDYIQPALPYGRLNDEGDIYFDLDAALGEEVDNLGLNLITPRFPDLSMPQDSHVRQALEYLNITDTTPEQRTAFTRCWIAQRANFCITDLCRFLEPDFALTTAVQTASSARRTTLLKEMHQECERVNALLQQPLSGRVEYYVDNLRTELRASLDALGS